MLEIVEDPSRLLDPELDIFQPFTNELPQFKDWQEEMLATKVFAEDGKTEYYIFREVLRQARAPAAGSGDEQATAMTLEIIKTQATKALEKLHDKKVALADKLTSQDGANSFDKNQDAHERTKRAHGISDSVEVKQPPTAPPFDTNLVGKRLEVCWPYKENGTTVKIWASGVVKRVADGLTDKRSAKARQVLPAVPRGPIADPYATEDEFYEDW
ncbi:hypothetical protein AB1Y20_022061 [Prymnesium parvum]|uniref:Uncharacterized protein n=1 Tax=Prymnesium parvum TaxID=97485 RepID=A0AB34JHV4_PRYPA